MNPKKPLEIRPRREYGSVMSLPRRMSAAAVLALAVTQLAYGAVEATPKSRDLAVQAAAEIRQIEQDLDRMNNTLNSFPSNEVAIRQPLQRQILEKQRLLMQKQRDLAVCQRAGQAQLSKPQAKELEDVARLWKSGAKDKALAAWKTWLTSAKRPDPTLKEDLSLLAGWVACRAAEDCSACAAIRDELVRRASN